MQKYLCGSENKPLHTHGSCNCNEHNHEHDHHHCDHSHDELYGEKEELPAVFSYSTSLKFEKEINGSELQSCLIEWIESLKEWVLKNKYFIGHIKAFVEDENHHFKLWISTTGKNVNIKDNDNSKNDSIKTIAVNMTAIVFGTDERVLKKQALDILNKKLPQHSQQ
ncbi:hypothetical protein I6U48_15120 [Clostridium sp. PL3]|uniref:Uncharacterized protein n=1 Tax=Clostridium thailandense TaxID=2794346 RepID=A0A949WW01_9CLOT|nr:hypothetical protein [Clostridium thailandense]